ncbi:ATP-binding protein [Paenibacillus melissococcoides]|uniref:histidine kinase n=1 Tax=Paenibacillus melissococcoides TaxID=2912268 RepID=A0ABN8UH16_9BACL|nr:ATP-binding protein [Paenibacillus melissococcoides]
MGDEKRLVQILYNLLHNPPQIYDGGNDHRSDRTRGKNAIKHGLLSRNEGGTIQLRITRQEGFTRIEVTDNGHGMEPDRVAHLLNPTLKGKGGIGLANTNRRLLQLYGRGLSIDSQPNEGTTVSFVIPDQHH